MLSGLGRSISHALVPPGLDRPPPLLLVSKGVVCRLWWVAWGGHSP